MNNPYDEPIQSSDNQNPIDEAGKLLNDIGSEAAKQGVKHAASVTASAGTDAALTASGVGSPIVIAKKVLEAGLKAFNILDDNLKDKTEEKKGVSMLTVFAIIFFCLYTVTHLTIINGTVGASSEVYHEEQYGKYLYGDLDSSTPAITLWQYLKLKLKFFNNSNEIDYYENYTPLHKSLDKNLEIINDAFEIAYEMAKLEVENEILEKNYDYDLTMESFNSNEYPYEFTKINYAELISIVSQKDIYNAENITFKKFKKLFEPSLSNDKLKYLYCMEIVEETTIVIETNEVDGIVYEEEKEVKYGKVTLLKYDLCSLYTMLDLNPNDFNSHYKKTRNIEMLDTQEQNLRFASNEYDFGSDARTIYDCGIGRKGVFDTQSYEDYLEILETLNLDDLTEAQRLLLEAALSKLGTAYSQEYRNREGYFDCSSFVAWVYRETLGITFGSVSPTAANMCKYLEESNCQVSSSVNYNNLEVGDLIFYSSKSNGRHKNITHVAFYAGNGMIIDASSSKGQVVYRKLWGANQVVSVCRPLQ